MTSTLAVRPPGTLVARDIRARLRPLYVTGFLQSFVLWYAIEKLFMRSIGLNDYLIALVTLIYIVVMMMANIPLGILADRWSRKGVLNIATGALIVSSLVCGLSRGLAMYAIGISLWGLFYAAYAGTYDSVIYDVVVEETGSPRTFEHYYGRWQMYDSAAFITSALLSAIVARFTDLRVAFLLTVPLTCCAFLTLSRFREPTLHRRMPPAHLTAHFGRIVRGTTKANVTWIVVALVANCVVMRLMIEFYQFWYLGLALPAVLYGPSCALLYCGVWGGGALADRLRGWRTATIAGFLTLGVACGLFLKAPALVVGAQVGTIMGVTVLNIVLTRHLHDAMPSNIRAGASSLVSTIGYGVFVPTALGFGLLSRAHGIFEASIFVAVPLGVVFVSVIRTRHWIHRPYPLPQQVSEPVSQRGGQPRQRRLAPGPAGPFHEPVRELHAQRTLSPWDRHGGSTEWPLLEARRAARSRA